jgi:ElaB/YqjD/DUF883 family membrane-anchored ribosome-binding protein
MSNTTTREAFRDTAAEAKEEARHMGRDKAASQAPGDVRADLDALQKDVLRLTAQLSDLLTSKGSAAWARARSNVEGVVSDAATKGQDAVDAVRDVGDNIANAIDESLRKRPYTTLALAVAIGFFFGATWRR